MIKIKLSKSKMLAYIRCPRAFKFHYVSSLPYPANEYMKAGIDVHNILEKFFSHVDSVTNPKEEYHEILKKLSGDKYGKFKNYFDNFVDFEVRRRKYYDSKIEWYKPFRREKKLFLKDYNAIIDRVDYLPDHGYIIADYKTGAMYPKAWEAARFELTFYAYMFWKRYQRPIWKIAIIPLKHMTQRFFNSDYIYPYEEVVTQGHYTEMFRIIEWINKQINAEIFPPNDKNCWGCPYDFMCKELKIGKAKKDLLEDWDVDNE